MSLFSFVLKAFWLVSGGKAPSLSSKPLLSPAVLCALIEGRLLCAVLCAVCANGPGQSVDNRSTAHC